MAVEPLAKRVCRGGTELWDGGSLEERKQEVAALLGWPQFAKKWIGKRLFTELDVRTALPHFFPRTQPSPFDRFFVTTSYSGLGTVEHVLSQLSKAFGARAGHLVLWSAFEKDTAARDMLLNAKHCPEHVFGDLTEQFDLAVIDHLHMAIQTLELRAQKQAKLACDDKEKREVLRNISQRCMHKVLEISRKAMEAEQYVEHLWCFRRCKMCPVAPPDLTPRDVVMEAGGNTCVAFSPQGARKQWLHESSVPAALWLARTADRARKGEVHIVFQECSAQFTTEDTFKAAFGEGEFKTRVLKVPCVQVGVPMQRMRKFSYTINVSKFALGREIDEADFDLICGQIPLCDGHDFWVADEEEVQRYLISEAKIVDIGDDDKPVKLPPDSVLSAGGKLRLAEYNAALEKLVGEKLSGGILRADCGVIDLSQNFNVRPTLKAELPSLLCHSLLWSQFHNRPLLPSESLLAMGWPIPHLLNEYDLEEVWSSEFLKHVKPSHIFRMTGNAMHCRVAGLLLAFCLSVTHPQ